jgi:hypothetical protein
MSWFSYKASQRLMLDCDDFYAFVMAAMRKADSRNLALLTEAFPMVRKELQARYDAPGGYLPGEQPVEAEVSS